MIINIEKETRIDLGLDYAGIAQAAAEEVLRQEDIPEECEAEILLINNKKIRELNREHRGIDRETDVLSFPMIEFAIPGILPEDAMADPETGALFLGDIVISLEKVRSQAKEYGHSCKREFAFLVVHSMLHLLGYDHVNSRKEEKIMEEKQESVLSALGITREEENEPKPAPEEVRGLFREKKRIVVKIGSSSLTHKETGELDLVKTEKLVRELTDLRNRGKDVVLVSSGAVMVGRNTLGEKKEGMLNFKQACASVGQARLMMIYQKLFSEYNQLCSQVLLTQENIVNDSSRVNAKNTFEELFRLGVIPVVNENDTVSTYGINQISLLGDNDRLSAIVSFVVGADLLILLSDIDGLYTDDPNKNKDAEFIETVDRIDDRLVRMGKGPASDVGTGGMATKISAAAISTFGGADMVIASGDDFSNIHRIVDGAPLGTVFTANKRDESFLIHYIENGGNA